MKALGQTESGLERLAPVSYTHLDVYKRQHHHRRHAEDPALMRARGGRSIEPGRRVRRGVCDQFAPIPSELLRDAVDQSGFGHMSALAPDLLKGQRHIRADHALRLGEEAAAVEHRRIVVSRRLDRDTVTCRPPDLVDLHIPKLDRHIACRGRRVSCPALELREIDHMVGDTSTEPLRDQRQPQICEIAEWADEIEVERDRPRHGAVYATAECATRGACASYLAASAAQAWPDRLAPSR